MNIEKLKELISIGYSISKIAKELKVCKTTIRYWLRKENIKTNEYKKCCVCNSFLTGNQVKFCSNNCKQKGFYNSSNSYKKQQERGVQRKLYLFNLMGGKCKECGYNKNLSAFDFHHKDRNDKLINLDKRTLSNVTWRKILLEAEKCELLCSNCHREKHNPEDVISELIKTKTNFKNFILK